MFILLILMYPIFSFCVKDKTTRPQVDENGKIFMVLRSWTGENSLPTYEEIKPFIVFLQNYAVPIIGERVMKKWELANPGNCRLNKLTAASMAYAVFVYESRHEVWQENIDIERMDHLDKKGKKRQERVKKPKYQHKPGTKLKLYEVGWTNDGRQYYNTIKNKFLEFKTNDGFWANMIDHWKQYMIETNGDETITQEQDVVEAEELQEEDYVINFEMI